MKRYPQIKTCIGLYFQKFLQDSVDFYLEMRMNSNGKDWFEGIPTCFTEF